jgi:opacity protein-like surface antigen
MKKLVLALIASAAVVGAAQAQDANAPRTYIGIGAATANHDYSINGLRTSGSDDWKTSAKIFGGYEMNNSWGLEAGYTDFRKSGFNYTNAAGVAGSGSSDGHAFYLAAKANMPLSEQFSAFGKLGVENTHRSFTTSTGVAGSDSDTGVYAGVGVQYNLSKQVALTAEYERYGTKKDYGVKPDVWTVGARYNF